MSSFRRGGSFRGGSFRGGSKGNTRFTGNKKRGRGGGVAYGIDRPAPVREDDGSAAAERFEEARVWDDIDVKLGFEKFESGSYEGETRKGWLVNMHQVSRFLGERPKVVSRAHGRRCSAPIPMRAVWLRWITISSRTTEECSRRRYHTSRTST